MATIKIQNKDGTWNYVRTINEGKDFHNHLNKDLLDKLSLNENIELTFDNSKIAFISDVENIDSKILLHETDILSEEGKHGIRYFNNLLQVKIENDWVNVVSDNTNSFSGSYNDLTDLPMSFIPSNHSHEVLEITGLQESLDSKATIEDLNTKIDNINTEITDLKLSVSNGKSLIATSITDKGVPTNSSDTFETMAININNIKSVGGYFVGDTVYLDNLIKEFGKEWVFSDSGRRVYAVAIGKDDYIYTGSDDKTVRKINSMGVQQWIFTDYKDYVWGIAIDKSFNVYSGSWDYTVKKLNSNGMLRWIFTNIPNVVTSVAVDNSDNIYTGSYDKTVRKINSSGVQQWSNSSNGGYVYSVATDSSLNVYSAGNDKTVRKINSSGVLQWTFTGHTSTVFGIALDSSGNIYSGGADKTVRKINSSGVQQWSFTGHTSYIRNLTVDSSNYIYSSGVDGIGGGEIKKINSNGVLQWDFTDDTDNFYAVAVDSRKNIYSGTEKGKLIKISEGYKILR